MGCFADDTRILIAISNLVFDVKRLQSDLHNVIQWSEKNNMALHKGKFDYIATCYKCGCDTRVTNVVAQI